MKKDLSYKKDKLLLEIEAKTGNEVLKKVFVLAQEEIAVNFDFLDWFIKYKQPNENIWSMKSNYFKNLIIFKFLLVENQYINFSCYQIRLARRFIYVNVDVFD